MTDMNVNQHQFFSFFGGGGLLVGNTYKWIKKVAHTEEDALFISVLT